MNTIRSIFIFVIGAFACTAACSDDYSVQIKNNQVFDLAETDEIIVECYCPGSIEILESDDGKISIGLEGEASSVGYHGVQQVPSSEPNENTRFVPLKSGKTLKLSSTEYTYIHHAFLISKVFIKSPSNIKISILKVPNTSLEARKVGA